MKLALILLPLFSAGCLHAATIVENFSLSSTAADGTLYNIAVAQFDPSLGTLTSVTIDATATSLGGSVQFTASTSGNRTLGIGSEVTITGPVSIVLTPNPLESQTYTGLVATDVATLTGSTSNDSEAASATAPPSDLSPYIGLGNVNLTAQGIADTLSFGSALGSTVDGAPNFSVLGTVTYTFEPTVVPEPGTALLGLVALGLGIFRRRR